MDIDRIGKKIKRLRLECGLTQEELAQRCELSKGYISQLENGLTSPSISTLADLLGVLGMRLDAFFSDEKEQKVVFGTSDYFQSQTNGALVTWLVPNSQRNNLEPILVVIGEGGATTVDLPHEGEEFGYVLSGRVRVNLGKFKYTCKKGESFYLKCDKEHWLENIGSGEARVLWVSSPPNF